VVPLDGSELAERVLPLAEDLARRRDAVLRLAHVHTLTSPLRPYLESALLEEHLQSVRRREEQDYLEQTRQRLARSVTCTAAVLDGPVAASLAQYAQQSDAELVVMATHGRGGLERVWLGSVADALSRSSRVPLLLLRPDVAPPAASFARVLAPLDGSEAAETILPDAVRLARLQPQSQLTLLHVIEPMPLVAWPPEVLMPPTTRIEDLARHQGEQARSYLCGVAPRLRAEGLAIATRLLFCPAVARTILEVADEQRSDLIALASHGRSGLARLALGSVADKVVRGSRVPVLLGRVAAGD
jgi:nucleotide-binding universal stress UspA family protein